MRINNEIYNVSKIKISRIKISHKTILKIFTLLSIIFILTTITIPITNSNQNTATIKKTNNESDQNKKTTPNIQTEQQNIKQFTSGYYDKGYRYNIQGWVYVHIEGEPYERGYQYGYLVSNEITDMIKRWSYYGRNIKIMDLVSIKDPERWWDILKTRAIKKYLQYYPEEYIQEMKGVTDGIKAKDGKVFGRDIEYEDIVTLNELVDSWYTLEHYSGKFHLLPRFLDIIKRPSNILTNKGIGCSAFIATGDATSDGSIVIAHSTFVPTYYVSQRFNIILDVQPTKGNRFIMSCLPGAIWSFEDYYQNDKGIVLVETSYLQSKWKERGIPIGVRVRNAIQYSNNIDDVISYLKKGNNGICPDEWLIGDTKTNEIASIELALYNTPVKRTFNGFYWSCNIPHEKKVQREIYGFLSLFPDLLSSFVDYKDEKFLEIEKQYYGKIDTEIAKKILGTYPICKGMSDGKITDSKMIKDLGLWAFMGNPNGSLFRPTSQIEEKFDGITELPASGWVDMYPLKTKPNNLPATVKDGKNTKKGIVYWKYEAEDAQNANILNSIVTGDLICTSLSSGKIFAINAKKGDHIWDMNLGEQIITSTGLDGTVYIGTETGLHAIQQCTGEIKWIQKIGKISTKPVIYENIVITGCDTGEVYAFDITSGKTKWSYTFSDKPFISEVEKNCLYVGSGDSCYSFDVTNNKIIWGYKTEGPLTVSPRIHDDKVYFGSWDGNLYALDSKNGKQLWKYKTGWGVDTTPYISDDIVYFGSLDNKFYALNKQTGKIEWYYTCNAAIHSSPLIYGESVFFGCDDGRLYALDKNTGALAWSFAPEYTIGDDNANNYITTPILSDPSTKDGLIYINVKGTVYALDSQTKETPPVYEKIKNSSDNSLYLISVACMCISLSTVGILLSKKKVKKKKQ